MLGLGEVVGVQSAETVLRQLGADFEADRAWVPFGLEDISGPGMLITGQETCVTSFEGC